MLETILIFRHSQILVVSWVLLLLVVVVLQMEKILAKRMHLLFGFSSLPG